MNMFNNGILQTLQNHLDELNNSLRKIVSAASVHSYWNGRICRETGTLRGSIVRVIGLDSAGISFCVLDPGEDEDVKKGECIFISFDSNGIWLSALSNAEKTKYADE